MTRRDNTRGQAFTLEGFVSSIVVLTAVLFALQSFVLVPNTAGKLDDDTRAELRREADDMLVTSANAGERDLTYVVRYWDTSEQRFSGAVDRNVGYGTNPLPRQLFDGALYESFDERGFTYNVIIRYRGDDATDGSGRLPLVYQGPPADDAVTASHTTTLYDNMTLTAPGTGTRELREYDTDPTNNAGGFYPIPDADEGSPLYNVVEVRVIVW